MAKIDIKETSEGVQAIGPGLKQQQQAMKGRSPSSKSPSPARRDAAPNNSNNSSADSLSNGPSNREGVSNESGYFEDEEEGSEVRENSIEIIFDKNASNNNSGNKASEGGKTGKNCIFWQQEAIYERQLIPRLLRGHLSVSPAVQMHNKRIQGVSCSAYLQNKKDTILSNKTWEW